MEIDPQELANREADIRGNTTDRLTREIPDSANLSRSWALLDFFQALQSNVTAWIKKVEHTVDCALWPSTETTFWGQTGPRLKLEPSSKRLSN